MIQPAVASPIVAIADARRKAADALAVTSGYAETVEHVAQLAVRHFSMFCLIDIIEDGVLIRRAAVAETVLEKHGLPLRAPHPDGDEGVARVLRSATPYIYGESWFDTLIRVDSALDNFTTGELRAMVMLPLIFDRAPIGVITLGQPVEPVAVDLALAEDFACLAAVAIANARQLEIVSRARDLAESSRARLSYVSHASAIFARSFDRATTLEDFVAVTVRDFADGARAHIVADNAKCDTFGAGIGDDDALQSIAFDAMRDARSRLDESAHLIAVPLLSAGRVGGALSFMRGPGRPPFVIDDLTMVEELAALAAMFVETSRAYAHQRRVAETLQQAFRPRDLPAVAGLTISAAYRPGAADVDIGGDWYDVFVMDDGRVAFAIGDVMGHGVVAAAVMAEIRSGLRAHLYAQSTPGRSLGLVDTLLSRPAARDVFATGVVAMYDPMQRKLTVANAGHPAPYLREANGTVRAIVEPSLLLGLDAGPRDESDHQLAPGDIVMFYTDGVVEDRARPYAEGVAALVQIMKVSATPDEMIERLLALTWASPDDRTLLAFCVH